jgi:hypothetical protein
MNTAGPSHGRLHERGEAKARRARPRVLVAVDTWLLSQADPRKETARNSAPTGGSAAASVSLAASVGAQ